MGRTSTKRVPYSGIKLPHIGTMLKKYCEEKRIRKAAWARIQGLKASTISGFMKKPEIPISTLFNVCQILKYNFIRDIADTLPAEFPPFKNNELSARVSELEKENEKLKNDIALLKEVIAMKS